MDVRSHNRTAWDKKVTESCRWSVPVSETDIERARSGDFSIVLTPTEPVPATWFPPLTDTPTLCLASAGGQQAPILAAAGASVTVFDNSPGQLEQDRFVASRDGLQMEYVEGDMRDLTQFADGSFQLIFHPCSNTFIPEVVPVWKECFRILQPGGTLLSGFTNPLRYLFDDERKENGNLEVRYRIPYSDLDYLDEEHIQQEIQAGRPLEFGHSLQDQIGGQLSAGFLLSGFYEDRFPARDEDPISRYIDTFIATRAVKPE